MNDNKGGKGLQFSTKKDRMIRVDDMEEKARVNLQVLVKKKGVLCNEYTVKALRLIPIITSVCRRALSLHSTT